MARTTLLFGSIGSVVETSDIQRRAYNQALEEAGLPWVWDEDVYADLLTQTGGKERLAMLASATGTHLTKAQIDAIHARKTQIACNELVQRRINPRPGVVDLIQLGKKRGLKIGFVTTTYGPNVDAIFEAAGSALSREDFDYIGTRPDVERGKPAPDAYLLALQKLALAPSDALAIEDTASSVMAAKRAGVTVVANPGAFSRGQDFWQADLVVDALGEAGTVDERVIALLD